MGDTGALVNKEISEVVDKKQLMGVNEAGDVTVDNKCDAGKLFLEYFICSKTPCCLTLYFNICAFRPFYYLIITVEF